MLSKFLLPALIAVISLFGGWWLNQSAEARGYARGIAESHAEADALALAATERNTETLRKQIVTLSEAQNARQKQLSTAQNAANDARRELDRLRDAISRGGDLPGTATNAAAVDRTAIGELLSACGERYSDLAREADGHAADSLMFQRGWPVDWDVSP